MTFADKTTLGQSAVLGIMWEPWTLPELLILIIFSRPGAHLSQNQFNWLGTIFYLSYLLFQVSELPSMSKYVVNTSNSVSSKFGAPKIPGWKMDEVRASLDWAWCEIFLKHVNE